MLKGPQGSRCSLASVAVGELRIAVDAPGNAGSTKVTVAVVSSPITIGANAIDDKRLAKIASG